jgi:Tfp pilus assembly PilM family ATPase
VASQGFEPLVEELSHSIDYFENEASRELKKTWIGGGGSLLQGAGEILSQELGKPVEIWSGAGKVRAVPSVDPAVLSNSAPLFNVALGMALRGAVIP